MWRHYLYQAGYKLVNKSRCFKILWSCVYQPHINWGWRWGRNLWYFLLSDGLCRKFYWCFWVNHHIISFLPCIFLIEIEIQMFQWTTFWLILDLSEFYSQRSPGPKYFFIWCQTCNLRKINSWPTSYILVLAIEIPRLRFNN